jgi:hypothetical protein
MADLHRAWDPGGTGPVGLGVPGGGECCYFSLPFEQLVEIGRFEFKTRPF